MMCICLVLIYYLILYIVVVLVRSEEFKELIWVRILVFLFIIMDVG